MCPLPVHPGFSSLLWLIVRWVLEDYCGLGIQQYTLTSSTPVFKCVNDHFRGSLTKMNYMIIGGTFVRRIFHIAHINLTMFFFPLSLRKKKTYRDWHAGWWKALHPSLGRFSASLAVACTLNVAAPRCTRKFRGNILWREERFEICEADSPTGIKLFGLEASINLSMNQSNDRSIHQSISQSMNLAIYQSIYIPFHLSIYLPTLSYPYIAQIFELLGQTFSSQIYILRGTSESD